MNERIKIPADLAARYSHLANRRNRAVQLGELVERDGFFMDYENREMQLIERIARLEAPLSDQECVNFGWMIGDRYRFDPENVEALIAARSQKT